jgi:dimethylhistidine N-methyltransferase
MSFAAAWVPPAFDSNDDVSRGARGPGGASPDSRRKTPLTFRDDVVTGLLRRPKSIPSKYFYDRVGSALFDAICETDEYYPTRTELAIVRAHAAEMAACIGPRAVVVEPGSGSGQKTRLLLDALDRPHAYVPIEISRTALEASAAELAEAFPGLTIVPVCGDFTRELSLPTLATDAAAPERAVVYFPGSTIGNFEPERAARLLARLRRLAGARGGLLVGVDLKKPPALLHAAYNDDRGVTARFNLNVLRRINDEIGASFRLDRFAHHALYDPILGRVEMHLVSLEAQTVMVDGTPIAFEEGEPIVTEYSYKYTVDQFRALARDAGLVPRRVWTDPQRMFSVHYFDG